MNFELSRNLKTLRTESGFSVSNICFILEHKYSYPICTKTYYKWESGETRPPAQALKNIADIFHTTVSGILTVNSIAQVLTDEESAFIDKLRSNKQFRHIVSLLVIHNKEVFRRENRIFK